MANKNSKDQEDKLNDTKGWLEEFKAESDRAAAILGAAYADVALEVLLVEFLVDDKKEVDKLLRQNKPLGAFGSKARMAYCLGLISKDQLRDLRTVAKIRNCFAHKLHNLDFNSVEILSFCDKLETPKMLTHAIQLDNRGKYLLTVYLASQIVKISTLNARDDKRKIKLEPPIINLT